MPNRGDRILLPGGSVRGENGLLYCVYSYQDEIEGKTSQRIRDVVCVSNLSTI